MVEQRNKLIFRTCNDSVFKELFIKVPNALAALISECLEIDYVYLKNNMQIEVNELSKGKFINKSTICDLLIKIDCNFKIDIEINRSNPKCLVERNLLYASRVYSDIIPRGTVYSDLCKYQVAQLNINTFSNNNDKVISKFMLIDMDTKLPVTQSMIIYNFDIAKCYDIYYNKDVSNIDKNNKLIRWGTILYTENISDIAKIMGDDLMEKDDKENFIKVLKNLDEKDRTFTDDDLLQKEEYRLAGERQYGIEQGIGQEKIKTVRNMLNEQIDISVISRVTDLTEEEIIKIRESE